MTMVPSIPVRSSRSVKGSKCNADGVPGALLRRLKSGHRTGVDLREVGLDLLATLTGDDDDLVGIRAANSSDDVPEHRASTQFVEHLRRARLHPRPLARSKDDRRNDRRPTCLGHEQLPPR